MPDFSTHPDIPLLERARTLSPFASRLLDADPGLLESLLAHLREPWNEAEMSAFIAGFDIVDDAALKRALRLLRKNVMLRMMVRDLNGLADLAEVMKTCTVLAEVAISFALKYLDRWQRELYGDAVGESGVAQELVVVGMGKLGGRELNVSSDVDLIFAYAEDGATTGPKSITNHEYFSRLGKRLISAIGEATADGFVFRVDMRLRPNGDSGPLVGSFAALEEYYQTQGREWERYAWIKGRSIYPDGGPAGPAAELEALLKPFVFRRYLDFGAFSSMRELKVQIQREVNRRDMHDNIKLGPGGIREIEFIAQVFQLIRGGHDISLQTRPTLAVLQLLKEKNLLPEAAVEELATAYVFLRNLEHRLQYQQDAQTQTLPVDDDSRARIAAAMNFPDWPAFSAELACHLANVERHFSEVFSAPETPSTKHPMTEVWQEGALPESEALQRLAAQGYQQAEESWQRLQALRTCSRYRQLPQVSRERFDTLMPTVIETAGGLPNPDATLARVIGLLETICRRASYLALLEEYPEALTLVVRLASASPWLANYLSQHPILLDELLDVRSFYDAPDFATLRNDLQRLLHEAGDDIERQMDVMRHFKHANVFRFAAPRQAGELSPEQVSDYLSDLADLLLDAVLKAVWTNLRGRHRDQPEFAIIGYGKLGGRELGYASDLDIIFLYDDDAPEAGEVYARFGQRINSWLNSQTSAGQLYEADLRLRPDGASGLLVSSIEAFEAYQRDKAWTWEHQALTRARFCAGDTDVGAAFERIRLDILCQPRDLAKLREEVVAMRHKMSNGHPNNSGLFDLKHDPGGIVDVEFIVQYLVLAHAAQHKALTNNIGNIALLGLAGELGLIPSDLAQAVVEAYRAYRREQHALRLQGEQKARVEPELFAAQREKVKELWLQVMGTAEEP